MAVLAGQYQARVASGEAKPDAAQEAVLAKLDGLAEALRTAQPKGLLARFRKPEAAPRGAARPC